MSRMLNAAASPLLTTVLLVGIGFAVLATMPNLAQVSLPGNQQKYEPVQPIAFSHRLHAGEMQVACLYCHSGAERSRHAGIPAASTCMNCHRFVGTTFGAVRAEDEQAKKEGRPVRRIVSPEIQKLYDAVNQQRPIQWVKIHNLPDFVYFDHRPHVNAGVACQSCHGPVETMERVRQVEGLSMGWCVNCHRNVNRAGVDGKGNFTSLPAPAAATAQPVTHRLYASIDCNVCHY